MKFSDSLALALQTKRSPMTRLNLQQSYEGVPAPLMFLQRAAQCQ